MSRHEIPLRECFACGRLTDETQSIFGVGHLSCYHAAILEDHQSEENTNVFLVSKDAARKLWTEVERG